MKTSYKLSGHIGAFLSSHHLARSIKTSTFHLYKVTREARKNLTTKFKNLATSLKKAVKIS